MTEAKSTKQDRKLGREVETFPKSSPDHKWWFRLAKVVYVVLYIPLLIIIPSVWVINAPRCNIYGTVCDGSYGEVFWYLFLTLAVYIIIVRLIKITFLYISFAWKPQWKEEFKRLF